MPKKVIFCLPGASFSKEFVECWSNALVGLARVGIQVQASFAYDPNLFYCRSKCLGCETRKGIHQKPYDSKIDYDYLFWIDSDVLFTTEDILRLLNHEEEIVSGVYIMHDNARYPMVENMDSEFFLANGHYKFVDRPRLEELKAAGHLFPVHYVGFGFMCIKKGVFESIDYPHFVPRKITFSEGIVEYASEDVSFCMTAREKGYTILVDPHVTVSHQKLIPLR